ncbi:MAG: hypothetical protein O7F73_05955 [Gammaproteobacteria bacterium]|nr:hypothetical protein [Gammaproteobacteria bacterium]
MAATTLVVSSAWGAGYLYRYVNNEGTIVIGDNVPPQFVRRGYEELNSDGSVNRVIKPSLSEDEKGNRSQEWIAQELAEAEAKRLRKYDESLLLRYSSIEDIEAARDRGLGELKIRISILRSNVRSLKHQVENNQARAADIERSGGTVSVEIVAALDGLRGEIVEAERGIAERSREMEVVNGGYQRDIDRFALLLDKVRLRNQRSAAGN